MQYIKSILLTISKDRITELFCSIDDFWLVFEPALVKREHTTGKKTRKRKVNLSTKRVLTIKVLFYVRGAKTFKHFCTGCIEKRLQEEF